MNKKVTTIVFGLALAGVAMPSLALNFSGLNQRNDMLLLSGTVPGSAKQLPVAVR